MPESLDVSPAPETTAAGQTPATEGLRFSAQTTGQPFEVAVLALQNLTLFPETVVPLGVGRHDPAADVFTDQVTRIQVLTDTLQAAQLLGVA